METENTYPNTPYGSNQDLLVTSEMKNYLLEAAKWAKFLAIVGFVFIGLLVRGAFTFGSIISTLMGGMGNSSAMGASGFAAGGAGIIMTVYFLLIALLYFFPCLYLYQFATRTQNAIRANLEFDLAYAFSRLKSFFKFIGILFIIILAFYALGVVAMLIGFAAR